MARLEELFDATQINPESGGGNLPVGKHKVVIRDSDIIPIGDGSKGNCIKFDLEIVEGPQSGTSGAWRLNKYYTGDKADKVRAIAERELSAVCHVTGVYQLEDTAALHGIPFIVEVIPQKGEGGEKGYTEIKKVFDANGNKPGAQVQNQQPVQNQASQQQPVQNQQPAGNGWGGQTTGWGGQSQAQSPPAWTQNK